MKFRYTGDGPVDVPELGAFGVQRGDVVDVKGTRAATLDKSDVWAKVAPPRRRKKAPTEEKS